MTKNAKKTFPEHTTSPEVSRCIEYLGLDKEGPNRGTRNKQELMKRTLTYVSEWKEGDYNDWISRLSIRLGTTTRTTKENYLDPLISEGIISRAGHQVAFKGAPTEDSL